MYLFVVFSLCISECFALKLRLLNSCVLVLLACLHYYIRRNNEIIWQHGPQLLVAVSLVVFFLVFSSLLWYEIILNVCLVLLKFCFSLLQIIVYGQKEDVSIFFLCDWFFFTCFLSVFLCFPWLLSISTKYTPIRSVILALHILSSSSSWVSSSSAAGLHKLVNSERTTLFSSKHMRLLGIMWCVSICMYVCR